MANDSFAEQLKIEAPNVYKQVRRHVDHFNNKSNIDDANRMNAIDIFKEKGKQLAAETINLELMTRLNTIMSPAIEQLSKDRSQWRSSFGSEGEWWRGSPVLQKVSRDVMRLQMELLSDGSISAETRKYLEDIASDPGGNGLLGMVYEMFNQRVEYEGHSRILQAQMGVQ